MLKLDNISGIVPAKQQAAVRAAVTASVEDGTFTYTDCMSLAEPIRTYAIQALDGFEIISNKPEQIHPVLAQGVVKLAHIDPTKSISLSLWETVRKPGTDGTKRQKAKKDFGSVADVPDFYPDRLARLSLHLHGWPIRQAKDGAEAVGSVVEVRWLEREANTPGAHEEIVALWKEIQSRPEFSGKPAEPKQQPTKSNRGSQAASAGV